MGVAASSFELREEEGPLTPAAVATALQALQRSRPNTQLAWVFLSGGIAGEMEAVGKQIAKRLPELCAILAAGPGVLSDRGELESGSAATGLMVHCPRARTRTVPRSKELATADLLSLIPDSTETLAPVALFLRSEGFRPDLLEAARRQRRHPLLSGAGTLGEPGLGLVRNGHCELVEAVSVELIGLTPPVIRTAHSCRLLGPFAPITERDGNWIIKLGGSSALKRLNELGSTTSGKPLLLTVLANHREPERGEMLIRGISGVDPDRGAILVGQEVLPHQLMSFAARDATAARAAIEQISRDANRALAGSAPSFALYFNCSARGQALYGTSNVDLQALRSAFPSMPIAGLQSAFEITPFDGAPSLQVYTGILTVFGTPS